MTMEIEMPERVDHAIPQPAAPDGPPMAQPPAAEPAADAPPAEGAAPAAPPASGGVEAPRPAKSLTIGAVCKSLEREFPDISISKIRYLEDQKLLSPRRTRGGYRLYSQEDVQRLRAILRLQRDEFLPLRVIRQELAAGRVDSEVSGSRSNQGPDPRALRRATVAVKREGAPLYRLADVLDQTGAEASLVKELEDYGVVKGERRDGEQFYDDTEKEIIRAVAELARFGVAGRNLRVFRTSADREAALLEQILAPSLRSRNPERRREAVEALENLAATTSHLKYLLLVRDLRRITS
jgi:DNA-binding transcriptional MerR regulator